MFGRLVPYEEWVTMRDSRVCLECTRLDGQIFPVGEGPVAPLHRGCRCFRRPAGLRWLAPVVPAEGVNDEVE